MFLCFVFSLSVSKLTQQNLLSILKYYLTNISPSTHIYQQSSTHAFTIFGICGVIATTLIWTKSAPFTCSVPLLRSLPWLPVQFRILFKTGFLTYKTLHEKQPVYLHVMLAASLQSRTLTSTKGINSIQEPYQDTSL